jgi:hypothetical protein
VTCQEFSQKGTQNASMSLNSVSGFETSHTGKKTTRVQIFLFLGVIEEPTVAF